MKIILRVLLIIGIFYQFSPKGAAQNTELESLLDAGIEGLLDATVVSASRSEQQLSDVAASVQIITAKEIRERGYRALDDLLADLPGFQFRNIQGFNSYVFQRGIPSQNNLILVMIDGVQVNELNSGGFYGGSQYLLENLEQVEIVYGPASALYGTNAMSGIINLITKKAKDHQGVELNAGYGSFNTFTGAGSYGYYDKEKKAGIRLAGRYFATEKTPLTGDAGDHNWTENLENFENNLSFDLSSEFQNFSLGMNLMNKKSSRATNEKTADSTYLDSGTLWDILFINGHLSYIYQKPKFTFKPVIYYRNSTVRDKSVAFITDTTQIGYYRPGNLLGIDLLSEIRPLEQIKLIGGLVLEKEQITGDFSKSFSGSSTEVPPAPPRPEMLDENLVSFYFQGMYHFLEYFDVIAGVRYDNSSYYEDVVTPRLSMSFHKGDFSSRLLYNEAFRAPRPWDFTSGTGNPDLKPETIRSFEWINSFILFKRCYLSASLYRNILNNIITIGQSVDEWRWINAGEISTDGLELEARWRDKSLTGWLNYTYNFSTDEAETIIPEISKHVINTGLHYYFNKWLNAGIRANYFSRRKNASLSSVENSAAMRFPEIDPALVINISTGFALSKNFELMLFINNLFDARYYHTSNRPPDRYPQAQRNIHVQLNYSIK
ncbi:MAG: TonB-dependent receptor [Sphingobacteriia bacterium]|nr:TonB-dependent receptor [Sphingobacteriia bacterium]